MTRATKLWFDCETRSSVPIKHGTMKYCSLDVQVIMIQWAVDNGEIVVEDLSRGARPSKQFLAAVAACDEIWAHHAEFDRTVVKITELFDCDDTKWRCTKALAMMHGLLGGLDKLSVVFKLGHDQAKDKRGKALIQLFCVPRADAKKLGVTMYNNWKSHPREWQEFIEYGDQDVVAMRAVWKKTPKWNATPRMWNIWHLDQRMNERGVAMDLKLAAGAIEACANKQVQLAAKTLMLTEGSVERTTQRDRLLNYMREYGVDLPDLTADTVERRLEDENLPEHIRELLRIRQQAGKASIAKYKRVITQHVNGRLCNLLVFCGATRTGRWAGRTLQPQNLPRPKHQQWDIEHAIKRFHNGTILAYAPDEVLGLASSCLRGLIVAPPGRRLVVSDLANIEGRFMAWVAGEIWKLEAFRAFDRKEGPDLYKIAYARAFQVDVSSIGDDSYERQIGKVMELALQYYGGVGAFCAMAETYGLDLDELATKAWPAIPMATKAQARADYAKAQKRKRTYGLSDRIWCACHALVLLWRAAHPAIVRFWSELDRATTAATRIPDKEFKVGKHIVVDRKANWLRIRLPSGRYLNYPAAQATDFSSSFLGVDPYTKQWKRISTYSGKRAENIVQGGSADIIMDGVVLADDMGYNPVLTVHDEAITEPPDDDRYNDEDLSKHLVLASARWTPGLPLAAKGATFYTYRK